MPKVIDRDTFQRLCNARDVLRCDLEPAPSIKAIAKSAAMSPFHFIRTFTAMFGETPHQLRTRARMERAKELLALRNDTVTEVCLGLGFSSLGSFTTLFGRRVGASPSAFRSHVRAAMTSPDRLPDEMTPGCLSLMAASPEDPQFSRSGNPTPTGRLHA